MTTLIAGLILVVLFAIFPLIGRERKDRRCLACPIKRALGGCNACGDAGAERPANPDAPT